MYTFLKCIGQAFLKNGLRLAAEFVPMGGAVYEIAKDGWASYCAERQSQDVLNDLKEAADATREQMASATSQVVATIAADRTPEEQQQLAQYLEQIPRSIRQSFRRPADPTGRTVPSALRIEKAVDLIPLLPARLPRFHEGQVVPGTDLVLLELLGMGGFGEVWKAGNRHFPSLPRVALKFCLDPAAKDRLLRHEAAVLNQVMVEGKHPGIVQLLHTHLSAEAPYLEYEYVAGGDLAGVIGQLKRQGKTDPTLTSKIIRNVARTVGFMHRLMPPVVHRDLKPANILVQQTKENLLQFKITDFGIGAVAADSELTEYTRRPTSYGEGLTTGMRGAYTPLYASPQQVRGEAPDVRDDVYSLGVIWYQLLTADLGLLSIPADWREEVQERGLSGEMVQLLSACLANRAERRPDDAAVLAERLSNIITPTDASGGGGGGGVGRRGTVSDTTSGLTGPTKEPSATGAATARTTLATYEGPKAILDWLSQGDSPDLRPHLRNLVKKMGEALESISSAPGAITFAKRSSGELDILTGTISAVYVRLHQDQKPIERQWLGKTARLNLWFDSRYGSAQRVGMDFWVEAEGAQQNLRVAKDPLKAVESWNRASERQKDYAEGFERRFEEWCKSGPDGQVGVYAIRFKGKNQIWKGGGELAGDTSNLPSATPNDALKFLKDNQAALWRFPRVGPEEECKSIDDAQPLVRKPAVAFWVPLDVHLLEECGQDVNKLQNVLMNAVSQITRIAPSQ